MSQKDYFGMSNFAQHQREFTGYNSTSNELVKRGGAKMDVSGVSWREWFVPPLVIPAALIIVFVGWVIYQAQLSP